MTNETNYLPWWSERGRYYLSGTLWVREDAGGDRHRLMHCGEPVAVFFHSDNSDKALWAKCIVCGATREATRVEDIWEMTATANQE